MNYRSPLAIAALSTLVVVTPASAQYEEYPDLTRTEELRLAMSAAPPSVSEAADVYVLGARGFERAIEGSNGWACLVERITQNKSLLAPQCLNPQATKSVLPAYLLEAELQGRGMDAEEIDAELRRQFASGELELPSGPAFAYMLSEGQVLTPDGGNFEPHFMLFVPYATNEDVGGDPKNHPEYPFVGPFVDHPLSTIVVITKEFVSPDEITIAGG